MRREEEGAVMFWEKLHKVICCNCKKEIEKGSMFYEKDKLIGEDCVPYVPGERIFRTIYLKYCTKCKNALKIWGANRIYFTKEGKFSHTKPK